MKVLLLGGTGAMGVPLVSYLANAGHKVVITSRSCRKSDSSNIHYIRGNAKEDVFLKTVIEDGYDAIVDFMHYRREDFGNRIDMLLKSTNHYFFLSSSKVYAPSETLITESSPRLLDVVNDEKYLATEEYALSKARCENILFENKKQNWTIIRPYITYNTERLQLGMFEKEAWLYRLLEGKSIVFSKDLVSKRTSMTHGKDVANVMAQLVEQKAGKGEAVNIVGNDSMTWGEVLELYLNVLKKVLTSPRVIMLEDGIELSCLVGNLYKFKYDRMTDRVFDSSKAERILNKKIEYMAMREGLEISLESLLENKISINKPPVILQAYMDKCVRERSKLREYSSNKEKIKYIAYRYTPYMKWKIKERRDIWW